MLPKLCLAVAAIAALAAPRTALAAVPLRLAEEGRLLDASGNPLSGTQTLHFAIYAGAAGGAALWSEAQSVQLDADGYFTAQLGASTNLTSGLFDGTPRFIGLAVGSDAEMTPRQPVASVPYALLANDVNGDIHPTSVSVAGSTVIDASGNWVGSPAGLQGPSGDTGPQGPAGAGFNFRGAFWAANTYAANDVAVDNGSSYVAQGAIIPGASPSSPGSGWLLMASAGDPGAQGPQGDPGAQGAQGPAGADGSGLIFSSSSASNTYFSTLGTCVNYAFATVTVTAPSAGTILVTANAQMITYHSSGTYDEDQIAIGSTATDCGSFIDDVTWSTATTAPTFSAQYQTFAVQRAFAVGSAGTYTYYLNGWKLSGGVASGTQDNFNYAAMHALFFHP